jgi:hypothetical protein
MYQKGGKKIRQNIRDTVAIYYDETKNRNKENFGPLLEPDDTPVDFIEKVKDFLDFKSVTKETAYIYGSSNLYSLAKKYKYENELMELFESRYYDNFLEKILTNYPSNFNHRSLAEMILRRKEPFDPLSNKAQESI